MKPKRIKIDELNSFDLYYAPMQIDIGSKGRRRELAEYLTDAFLFFFATYEVQNQYGTSLTKQLYEQLLADKISDAVTKVTGIDSYMSNHIKQMSKEVVNTTFKNAKSDKQGVKSESKSQTPTSLINNPNNPLFQEPLDSPLDNSDGSSLPQDESDYWLSYKRAEDIAKSEANTFLNYTDYLDAKELGKTKKRWLTMLDDKVRQTHSEVEGETVDIDEVFHVGNSLMRFPHDLAESPDPKEVIGCRCAVEYL